MDVVGARPVPPLTTAASPLYDPSRHEPLREQAWDPARARAMIERIVEDAEASFSPVTYWPAHPRDTEGRSTAPFHCLYFGACGVIWTLYYLQARGFVRLRRDYEPFIEPLIPALRAWMGDDWARDHASYLMGETAPLLLAYWLRPSGDVARKLEAAIASNIDNPTRELLWGAPGTMLGALFMHERTGEARWADAFRANVRKLESQLLWSDQHRCSYWTQDMYGRVTTYLGAGHGFAGNAFVIIRGRHLLDAGEWGRWKERIATTVRQTATVDQRLANWRAFLEPPRLGMPLPVQWCHGAPGFLACLGDFPGDELDDLLLAAGELTWIAGPLTKGAYLCHGTGGNGYAFLKLHERTGDAKWLERARAFAMHGIGQSQAQAEEHRQMRYSLWTGDLGLAVYLADCLDEGAAFPTFDVFFAR